jgi:ubiquinone/menaquinone biosynthesis C-methylase UbiE
MKALSIIAGARSPEDPEASRRVGRLAMEARKDLDRLVALPLFEASVRLDSGNTRSRSVLGQLHHDVGNWRAGMRELQRVVEADPRDNHALLHLGWCRLQVGLDDGDEGTTKLATEELATALHTWANDVRTLKMWSQWRHQIDRLGEFTRVVELAGVKPGMSVADVGAGEGYYAVRLSQVVGPRGRVLAEDIVPEFRTRLAQRVQSEKLDNVAVVLGEADDPKLPARSFDRIFLVHMYHEVSSPYAFLWHLRDGLKPGGQVIVVDANRAPQRHGFPPALLKCEFAAVGLQLRKLELIAGADAYFAAFEAAGERPKPSEIKPCQG